INPQSGQVGLTKTFDRSKLIPIQEDQQYPVYIFSPLSFEQYTFGYAALSYGEKPRSYPEDYRLWIHTVVRGLEGLRRRLVSAYYEKKLAQSEAAAQQGARGKAFTQLNKEDEKIRQDVAKLLDENLFEYHFQPIVSARSGEIFSYEALMRSGGGKKIPPLTIIHHAEGMGRLGDIEKATFINILDLMDKNPELFEDRKVFINSIPGCAIKASDAKKIKQGLISHEGAVVIELTEQAELSDEDLARIKEEYKTTGAGMAVDDYGTGYSNVANLLRYMPDVVKIDRALLSNIQASSQKEHFVRDIIEFCHSNDILALAEGVETTEELRAVIRLGADLIQGYYTAKPAKEVIASIDETIKDEIIRYYHETMDGSGDDEYIAGRVSRVSAANLIREHKKTVILGAPDQTFRDITLAGMPGMEEILHVEVLQGYDGRLTLENMTLSNTRNRPCIRLAPGSHLTLRLVGQNYFTNGSILVPESAHLEIEGEGTLNINNGGDEIYGIGNALDKTHGRISFYQEGEVNIDLNGKTIVGVGSGLGGNIDINSGQLTVKISGGDGVCIGAMNEKTKLDIHNCAIETQLFVTRGAGIGSLLKDAKDKMHSCKVDGKNEGKEVVCIGTVFGDHASLNAFEIGMFIKLDSEAGTILGALSGRTDLSVTASTVKLNANGREVYAFGGYSEDTAAAFKDADVNVTVTSDNGKETNAPEGGMNLIHGRYRSYVNGVSTEK
ncbi:MAG: EAL domain-containing protein, partial [Lachnospiraceae bacterium]|nr:EAL domain-containing protein [Lachnospiraceae bacterium]